MIQIECPYCSRKLSAPEHFGGRQVSCKKCNGRFLLPRVEDSGTEIPAMDTKAKAPGKKPSAAPRPAVSPQPKPAAPADSIPAPAAPPAGFQAPNVSAAAAPASVPSMPIQTPGQIPAQVPAAPIPAVAQPPASFNPAPAAALAAPGIGAAALPADSMKFVGSVKGAKDLIEARGWGAFFDFRIEKFLTPKILRTLWMLALIAALVAFIAATLAMVLAVITAVSLATANHEHRHSKIDRTAVVQFDSSRTTADPVSAQLPDDVFDDLQQFDDGRGGGFDAGGLDVSGLAQRGGVIGFLFTMLMYAMALLAIFVVLCLIRMAFECIKVLFTIAASLKTIEANQT